MANAPFPKYRLFLASLSLVALGVALNVGGNSATAFAAPPVAPVKATPPPAAPAGDSTDDEIMSTLLGGGAGFGSPASGSVSPSAAANSAAAGKNAPPNWYGQFETAVRLAQSGKRAQAATLFRNLLHAQPHIAAAWANLGLLDAQGGQSAAAAQDLKHAIAETREPHELAAYWAELTMVDARASLWPDCAVAARKTLDLAAGEPGITTFASAYLGVALLHQAKYAEALPVLEKRPHLQGEAPQAPDLRLIFAQERTGAIPEALATAKDLAKRYPKIPAAVDSIRTVGDFAVNNGRYDVALDAYRSAFAAHPDNQRLGLNIVAAAVRVGQSDLALATLRSLLARTPKDPKVNFEMGLLLSTGTVDAARLKEAEGYLQTAAIREPTNALYVTQLGLAVVLQGPTRLNDAIGLLKGALKLDPGNETAHLYLGYAFEQQAETDKPHRAQHFAEGIDQYDQVIALDRHNYNDELARNRKAGLLYTIDRKDEAYRGWSALVERYLGSDKAAAPAEVQSQQFVYAVNVLSETASRLLADGRFKEADRDYTHLTTLSPNDPRNYVGLGQAKERLSDLPAAQAAYEKALQIEPDNATAALTLGGMLKGQHKPAAAIAVYEKALAAATAPSNRGHGSSDAEDQANQIRLQLGSDDAELGQKDKALAVFRTLTLRKDDPNRSVYLLTAPRFLIAEKRYAEAEQDLKELTQQNPTDDEAAYELARAESLNNHGAAAIETLKPLATRYVNDPPRRIRALMQIADVEAQTGQFAASAAQYEDVLRFDPQQSNALAGLSADRTKLGHPEAAGAFLEDLAMGGDKSPNDDILRDLMQLYLVMDRTPDRFDAFAIRLANRYPKDRRTQLFALSSLLSPSEAVKPANRTAGQAIVDRLLLADAKDAQALYWRGDLRELAGSKPEAIADYTAAVVSDAGNAPAIAALTRLGAPIPKPPTPPAPAATTATAPAAPTPPVSGKAPVGAPTAQPSPSAPPAVTTHSAVPPSAKTP